MLAIAIQSETELLLLATYLLQRGPLKPDKTTSQLKMASLDLQKALEQWSLLSDQNKRLSPNEKALEDMKALLKELKEKLAQFE